MVDELFEISKSTGIPVDDVLSAFQELKSKGWIYTPAKTAKQFATKKYPFRLVFMSPAGLKKPSEVSFGPFPVKRELYKHIKENMPDSDVRRVYLGFIRLAYEKTGGAVESGYRVTSDDDVLNNFLSLMEMWDTDAPVVYEHFVWIIPNDKCKRTVEKITGKEYSRNDFSWWNTRLDLGKKIKPTTLNDYPDKYGLIPNEIIDAWARYLPSTAYFVATFLYSQMTRGGEFKGFKNIDDVLDKIQKGIELDKRPNAELATSYFDRELLIKELCDFNSLTYPVDSISMLEFMQQVGIIQVNQTHGRINYSLAKKIGRPKKIFKIPKAWEERMDKFLTTGSAMFSYLSIDEITKNA